MFESLSTRLNKTFRDLAGFGKITPENIEPALKEIRVALLEADVHFKVVKSFLDAVKARAIGAEVLQSITPADQFVKIVHDELARTLGAADPAPRLNTAEKPPTKILLCGLQGAGKTTAASKLVKFLGDTTLVALDLKRPAAIEQLRVLAEKTGAPFIPPSHLDDAVASARSALAATTTKHVVFDTAGRLQIDSGLMAELKSVHAAVNPDETVLVLDAMTGQEAVKVADAFHKEIPLTAILLSKTDGDARGGAALSVRFVTGVPIKWIGTGEGPGAFEAFHPERFAGRILGMGDVVSLVERAARTTDMEKAEKMARRIFDGQLDLEMFLDQIREMRKMGPMAELFSMIPGAQALGAQAVPSERDVSRFEAIILSMTATERRNPEVINNRRRERIAQGSGTTSEDVHRMLKQFRQARQMISAMTSGGKKGKALRQMMGM
ncbi:MAG: signal recognition particle protein [Candidatus Hydrogenedentota bacterium]